MRFLSGPVPVFKVAFCVALLSFFPALPSSAQQEQISKEAKAYAGAVSRECDNKWRAQDCLGTLSESAMVLASNYAASLEANGQTKFKDPLKEHCAAATAAMKGAYPADAMNSAYSECANAIYDISQATGINPDMSHYQLLVGSVLCLSGHPQCSIIEAGLRKQR